MKCADLLKQMKQNMYMIFFNIHQIAGLYADDLFNKEKYIDAVKVYSQSNKSFE